MTMLAGRSRAPAVLVSALGGVLAAVLLHSAAPDPSADVARGGEDAFARGLHPRELPPRAAPLRWTRERAELDFRFLPRGNAALEVELAGQRGPVAVAVDGVIVGTIEAGGPSARFALRDNGTRARHVELRAAGFRAGDGRVLGAQLRRVTLRTAGRGSPPPAMVALLALAALGVWAAASVAGSPPLAAAGVALGTTAALTAVLWPRGVVRSSCLPAAVLITLAGAAAAACAVRLLQRRWPDVGGAAFAALMLAVVIQGLAATSPVMVVSDAVFHANNLAKVAGGDLWITSQTQHAPPFRFPYGVTFYALLAPFARAGLDPVMLVRAGGALAGLAGSLALLWLMAPRGDARAGLAVAALQLLPVTFDLFSFGNLSNVFGQAMTAAFFAWWVAARERTWPLGALLLAAGAVGHFSSFVVLLVLAAALAIAFWSDRRLERWRLAALAIGAALAIAYYAHFVPLVTSQLGRVLHGGSGGGSGGASASPIVGLAAQWGLPAILLAILGRPWPAADRLDRALLAYWAAGAVLLAAALLSPLDVRYGHALTLPVAVAVAEGLDRAWRRRAPLRIAAAALALAQVVLAARAIVDAVLWRYRP
jgi:hypothetical protein